MAKTVEINDTTYYTYADLDDAQVYNNAIYGSTWSSIDEVAQAQLLVMATRKIDSYKYAGSKVSDTQELKFPRVMMNGTTSDEQTLINLCCQIAAYYLSNGTSSSGGDSSNLMSAIDQYQVGDLKISFKDDATIDLSGLDDFIEDALSEWLYSNSMQIWL